MNDRILPQFSTLSDLTRVRLIRVLVEDECSVTELVSILKIPQSTISRHIKIILEQGWISKREDGNSNCYQCKMESLPASYQALWKVLATDQHPLYPQDYRRLQTIISLRNIDSTVFFQQHAAKWTELRTELFGDNFILPTLLSIVPSHLCIADLGCGNGDALLALAPTNAQLIGVDISLEMLSIAKERLQQYNNISLRQGPLTKLPLQSNEVDRMFCMLVLHHIADINKAFVEMHRCLKKNGQLIVLDMLTHQHQEFKQMGHQHLGFSREDLENQSLFRIQSFQLLPKSSSALGPELFIAILQSHQ